MKILNKILLLLIVLILSGNTQAQTNNNHKGKFYLYWGWNRSAYTKSDMQFTGEDYNFNMGNVRAKDRQSPFQWDVYFNPKLLSIPQYNMRFGYFLLDNYEISIGVDHMKYIMVQDQSVYINGEINIKDSKYNDEYFNDEIKLTNDFLIFEHSDGLNYINASFKRFDNVWNYKFIDLGVSEGIEIGGMMPRTNATLLEKTRNDEFHWAGYAVSILGSLRVTFWQHFFVQSEIKLGTVNLPDVRTTPYSADKMAHNFSYIQSNILFGYSFQLIKIQ